MKTWIQKSLPTLLALGVLVPALGWARPGPEDRGDLREGDRFVSLLEENAERLGIAPETLERARRIDGDVRKSSRELQRARRRERRAMRRLLAVPVPDEGAVMRQIDAMTQIDAEMQKQRMRSLIRLRSLLSPEQISELAKIRREQLERRRGERRRFFRPRLRERHRMRDGAPRDQGPPPEVEVPDAGPDGDS